MFFCVAYFGFAEFFIRAVDDNFKLSKCIQIARLYLEDDDAVNAEAFINKASFLVSNSQNEVLNLQYKVGPP
jgi:COP9 signalosome complex subunit 4